MIRLGLSGGITLHFIDRDTEGYHPGFSPMPDPLCYKASLSTVSTALAFPEINNPHSYRHDGAFLVHLLLLGIFCPISREITTMTGNIS